MNHHTVGRKAIQAFLRLLSKLETPTKLIRICSCQNRLGPKDFCFYFFLVAAATSANSSDVTTFTWRPSILPMNMTCAGAAHGCLLGSPKTSHFISFPPFGSIWAIATIFHEPCSESIRFPKPACSSACSCIFWSRVKGSCTLLSTGKRKDSRNASTCGRMSLDSRTFTSFSIRSFKACCRQTVARFCSCKAANCLPQCFFSYVLYN